MSAIIVTAYKALATIYIYALFLECNMAKFDGADFLAGDAEASETLHVKCSSLRKGGLAMLQGFPCKIVEMSKAQPGKHGHAKIHLIGLDVFTGKKHEDICPAKDNIEVSSNIAYRR